MKKIIKIFLFSLAIGFISVLLGCSNVNKNVIGDAIKLVAVEDSARLGNLIVTTEGITFKCSSNYLIGENEETGDFIFSVRDVRSSMKTLVLSCDKIVTKVYYYSNKDELIFKNEKAENEWIEVDTKYRDIDCRYILVFVENDNTQYYAKFIRN